MKKALFFATALFLLITVGCSNPEKKRIQELQSMPVLWESKLLPADSDLDNIIPLENSYDPNIVEFWKGSPKTGDYIPISVFAYALPEMNGKPRKVTLKLGDRVSVLAQKKGQEKYALFLIRTKKNTYAWLYAFHLQDKKGKRMATFTM